jgi:chromosome segregation ATPase
MRQELESDLKRKNEEAIQQTMAKLDAEKNSRIDAERKSLVIRTEMEDTQIRLKNMEESRDRLTNQLRTLEISIEPTKSHLEKVMKENLSLKEEHMNASNTMKLEITNLRDELQRAKAELAEHNLRQKQREESLRVALTQYFQK